MALEVHIILKMNELGPNAVLEKLGGSHPEILGKPSKSGGSEPESRYERNFHTNFRGMGFHYYAVHSHSVVRLECCTRDVADAWRWIKPFTSEPAFRQAFLFESDYWRQIVFALPMATAGNISWQPDNDTSPGWHAFREGYVEYVPAAMWLGRPFWKLSSANRKKVLAQPWLKCKELPHGVLEVRAWPKPFTSDTGEEGDVQNRLRDLLYPNHEELRSKKKGISSLLLEFLNTVVDETRKEFKKEARKANRAKKH